MKKSTFKPYQLVHVSEPNEDVQSGMHRYVGEVMSLVTPDDTIMVRRVPGFPGSLVELPTGYLQPCTWKAAYVHMAAVSGRGLFPVDMLRYDSCVPVNFDLEEGRAVLSEGMGAELLVARATERLSTQAFTPARWLSFLWGLRQIVGGVSKKFE